ncbi:MAG: DivIVA domain-containing protein [Coriobacteriia bacterium]|nr:DivIVA domain-containing protein [Coriobacteriia bacterium]
MSITATEIQNIRFSEARRGYNPDEVDEFLERVASDVDTLNRALAEAATRVSDAEERARAAEERAVASAVSTTGAVQVEAPVVVTSSETTISDDVISRAFIAAQLSADNLKEEARKEAEKLYREAEAKAKDIVSDAHSERERVVGEIDFLRESSERFRTEFLSLVNHYMVDAQRRFVDFADLVPDEAGANPSTGTDDMLVANDAAVSSANAGQAFQTEASNAPRNPQAATPSPSATGAPLNDRRNADPANSSDMSAAYNIDEDLEIEEID